MSIVSKLTFPALMGGLIAVAASGIFAPPAHAQGYDVATLAQVSDVAHWDQLNVRRWPAAYSQQVGVLGPQAWVWVERCIESQSGSDWCLVRRETTEGWVNSRYLTPGWP
ncbi:SH3 domain-containing protein [Pelagibacterium montanilacus]|uniref:SH3 domain-containing protein n=1 Tax=Pelagibacterium montanilacus TaxID=2185280 RepID=UPI000F8EB7A3|nr:hypothetical protein [Pelagibacterium montanilacus]